MNNIVLLPIIKEYSDKIFDGEKLYEFRKSSFKKLVDTVVVYESRSNIKDKIVGYFTVDLENSKVLPVEEIIEFARSNYKYTGISTNELRQYYKNCKYGYIIKIDKIFPCRINHIEIFGDNFRAPQNFYYIEDKTFDKIKNKINSFIRNKKMIIYSRIENNREFPNLLNDLAKYQQQFILDKKGYVVINKEKNKITRIEKIENCSTKRLIDLAIKELDKNKKIYINVPEKRVNLIKNLLNQGFEIKDKMKNKYNNNDSIFKLELKCK